MAVLLIFATLAVVVTVLARAVSASFDDTADTAERAQEDAKVAKYRELRDLDLDWRTGKLSDTDYRRTRGQLRAEAAELLNRADGAGDGAPSTGSSRDQAHRRSSVRFSKNRSRR